MLVFACMFLGALDFINRYFFCVFIGFFLFAVTPKRKFTFTPTVVVLLALSLSLLLFNAESQKMLTSMLKPFVFPICYLMGLTILRKKEHKTDLENDEKRAGNLFFLIALGLLLHFGLNMLVNMNPDLVRDEIIDFWTNDLMSATAQAALATMMLALVAAYFFSRASIVKKVVALLSLALILSYNLILAGRTVFLMAIIVFTVAALHLGLVRRRFLKTVAIILILVLLLLLLYNANLFGIRTAVEDSNFYDRFFGDGDRQDIEEDKRMEHKRAYFIRMADHLFGGGHIRAEYGHSAHDLYLDTYDESGIFALLAVLAYIATSLARALRFVRNKRFSFELRQVVLCFYIAMNVQFFLEPIMRGMPWLFAAYCFLDAVVAYLLTEERSAHRSLV